MTAAPNFGAYGDYYFVMYWVNGDAIAGGTERNLRLSGTNVMVYFRDP